MGQSSGQNTPQQGEGKQAKARDRNRPENAKQDGGKPGQKPGEKPNQSEPKGGKENNTGDDPARGDNLQSAPPKRPGAEAVNHRHLDKRWGLLPPERRQKLVDRNFKDFTPEYEREIKAYFRKIVKRQ